MTLEIEFVKGHTAQDCHSFVRNHAPLKTVSFLGHLLPMMILGQISYLDCIAFLLFLLPQLLINVNTFELAWATFKCIPFFRESQSIP